MEYWQYLPTVAAAVLILAAFVYAEMRKNRERKLRDFTRKLETLLQPNETVKVICPQRGSRCILTNNRIIFENRGDFAAFPLKAVQRVQGKNKEGNRTTVPAKMVSLTVKLEKEYTLRNTGIEFEQLTKLLQDKVKKQNDKKKTAKK